MRNSEKQYPHTYSSPLIKGVRGLLCNIANLKPGDHLCCLYETEEEHRALLTPFLRQGLEQGEKVLYIVDARTAETVLDYLRDDGPALERSEGLDVEPYLASGQLGILTVDDAYMRNGVFDPDGMIALLRSETERALVEGYAALRVTGEMTWALRGLPGSERLIEYESKLNTFFPGSKCLAICQYDRRVFDPVLLLDVLVTHPIAVVGTEIYDNFYYMPPEDFLSDNRPEATLRDWLKNLVERRRTEEEIRRLARFPGENPNPVLQITYNGAIVYANQASLPLLNVWGCKIGQSLPAGQRELIGDVICSGVSKTIDVEVEGREFSLTFAPIADAGYINVYGLDITEHKRVEETLAQERNLLRTLIDNMPDFIYVKDAESRFVVANIAVAHVMGGTLKELLGKTDFDFYPYELAAQYYADEQEMIRSRQPLLNREEPIIDAGGNRGWILSTKVPLYDSHGNAVGLVGIGRDITERKRAEEQIKASLEEKESLLREVHHRVKNNMQVISSLLRLQEREIKDERYSEMLKESQNRIKSISLVHEKLYKSENLADIDLGDYIKSLANSLFQSYGTKGLPSSEAKGKIALKVDCEDVRLPIDSAIPCGLILNELISNSLKHAFPEDKEGEINISLRSPGDEIELVVSDNGVGIPEGLGFRNTESLGLHLVKILAEGQLHGKIELERTAGTSFRIRFDKKGSAYFRK